MRALPPQNMIEGGKGVDTVGPVEVVIISYPEIGLVAGVSTVLEDFVGNDQLRIVDAILVSRGEHGQACGPFFAASATCAGGGCRFGRPTSIIWSPTWWP